MTREEAINMLYGMRADNLNLDDAYTKDKYEALELAIKALEQGTKTGHWIKYGIPRCGEQHYKCTNCDEYFNFGLYSDYYKKAFKYCPNCGCRMVETQESEDQE